VSGLPQYYKVVQMCPDPQLISIYTDGELPSPWKEKMESHLTECSACREKFENFKHLQELFKKDTRQRRTIVKRNGSEDGLSSQSNAEVSVDEAMKSSMERVWRNLESRQHFRSDKLVRRSAQIRSYNMLRRRISIPVPVAAAAAVVIALVTALWVRGGSSVNNNGFTNIPSIPVESTERTSNFILASEQEMPDVIPTADISGVLQYLGSDHRSDIIILQLPEGSNFLRSGEPAIIRAADNPGR
jgi:hypothetical protein